MLLKPILYAIASLLLGISFLGTAFAADEAMPTIDAPVVNPPVLANPPVTTNPPAVNAQVVNPPTGNTSIDSTPASSTTSPAPTMAEQLALQGISYQFDGQQLNVTIDQAKALAAIPKLQTAGVIPADISQAEIDRMPITAAADAVGITFTIVLAHTAFLGDPKLNVLHVQAYFLPTGSQSEKDKQLCFSFDTDRATYDKVNWDTVTAKEFISQTPSFKFSDWCTQKMNGESNSSGNSKPSDVKPS